MSRQVIVNIRGGNAAGKTTLARFFHEPNAEPILGVFNGIAVKCTLKTVPGLNRLVLLLGKYDASKYSGMDKVKSVEAVEAAIHAAVATQHHVVFEGFYVSKSWERYAQLRNKLTRENPDLTWLWAFLHASEELIFARSEARRDPGSRPMDKKELGAVVRQMAKSRQRAISLFPPREVLTLRPEMPPEELFGLLVTRMAELEG